MEYKEFVFTGAGKRQFTLSEDSISVKGRGLNVTLLLKGLEPEYRTIRHRSPACYVGLLFLVLALVLGLTVKAGFPIANLELHDAYVLAGIIGTLALVVLLPSWRKVEHAVFKNTTGINAISIARAGPDSSTFDQFVAELSRRIRQAKDEEGSVAS